MRMDLRHKVVCITGAAGGIGRAIAEAFAREGARLALIDLNTEGLVVLAAALRTTGAVVHTVVADLRTEQGVRQGTLAALAPYEGVIDIMVPNVGALIAAPFETLSDEQWQEAFAINFFTHVYACRVAVPLMKQRGGAALSSPVPTRVCSRMRASAHTHRPRQRPTASQKCSRASWPPMASA